jgi:hypothetical protein
VLRAADSIFDLLLNSQRHRIYWILDDALLHIILNEWEKPEGHEATPNLPWHKTVAMVVQRISEGTALMPEWAEKDGASHLLVKHPYTPGYDAKESLEMLDGIYFPQSRKFLDESLKQYWTRWKVNASLKNKLPVELSEVILNDVAVSEEVFMGSLRTKYIAKGKCTAGEH